MPTFSVNIKTIVVKTAAQWAVDTIVYIDRQILITSDEYYTGVVVPKFKIGDGANTWDNLDFFPDVQLSLNAHTSNFSNPHNVNKAAVGLALANNTSDVNKPVSTAQQTALDLKLAISAFTNAAVTAKTLTGLSVSGTNIVSTDTILQALGKAQNQLNALLGGVNYQGTWNATTNIPAIISSVGTKGYYYVVSVPGATNLNGITDWKLGDWVIFNGAT